MADTSITDCREPRPALPAQVQSSNISSSSIHPRGLHEDESEVGRFTHHQSAASYTKKHRPAQLRPASLTETSSKRPGNLKPVTSKQHATVAASTTNATRRRRVIDSERQWDFPEYSDSEPSDAPPAKAHKHDQTSSVSAHKITPFPPYPQDAAGRKTRRVKYGLRRFGDTFKSRGKDNLSPDQGDPLNTTQSISKGPASASPELLDSAHAFSKINGRPDHPQANEHVGTEDDSDQDASQPDATTGQVGAEIARSNPYIIPETPPQSPGLLPMRSEARKSPDPYTDDAGCCPDFFIVLPPEQSFDESGAPSNPYESLPPVMPGTVIVHGGITKAYKAVREAAKSVNAVTRITNVARSLVCICDVLRDLGNRYSGRPGRRMIVNQDALKWLSETTERDLHKVRHLDQKRLELQAAIAALWQSMEQRCHNWERMAGDYGRYKAAEDSLRETMENLQEANAWFDMETDVLARHFDTFGFDLKIVESGELHSCERTDDGGNDARNEPDNPSNAALGSVEASPRADRFREDAGQAAKQTATIDRRFYISDSEDERQAVADEDDVLLCGRAQRYDQTPEDNEGVAHADGSDLPDNDKLDGQRPSDDHNRAAQQTPDQRDDDQDEDEQVAREDDDGSQEHDDVDNSHNGANDADDSDADDGDADDNDADDDDADGEGDADGDGDGDLDREAHTSLRTLQPPTALQHQHRELAIAYNQGQVMANPIWSQIDQTEASVEHFRSLSVAFKEILDECGPLYIFNDKRMRRELHQASDTEDGALRRSLDALRHRLADEPHHMHKTVMYSVTKLKASLAEKSKKLTAWAEKYAFDLSSLTNDGSITIDWKRACAVLGQNQPDTPEAYIVQLQHSELAVAHAQGLLMADPELSDIDRTAAKIDRFGSLDTSFRDILDRNEEPIPVLTKDTIMDQLDDAGSHRPSTLKVFLSDHKAALAGLTGGRLIVAQDRFAKFMDKVTNSLKEVEDWGVKYGFDMDSLTADGAITLDWKKMQHAE